MANVDLFKRASSLKVKPAAHNGLSVGSNPTLPTSFPPAVNDQITDSVTQSQITDSVTAREKPKLKDIMTLVIINPVAIIALAGIILYHFFG
jgi:hypothetical protein